MITLATLKAHLGITTSADDAVLTALEQAAVEFVQNFTGRYFGPPDETTEIFDGVYPSRALYPLEVPFGTPAPVLESRNSDNTWTAIDPVDYELIGSGFYPLSDFPTGTRNIRITYTRGYEAGEEPADIRAAVINIVGAMYSARGSGGMKSETIGGYSYTRGVLEDDPVLYQSLSSWQRIRV